MNHKTWKNILKTKRKTLVRQLNLTSISKNREQINSEATDLTTVLPFLHLSFRVWFKILLKQDEEEIFICFSPAGKPNFRIMTTSLPAVLLIQILTIT